MKLIDIYGRHNRPSESNIELILKISVEDQRAGKYNRSGRFMKSFGF